MIIAIKDEDIQKLQMAGGMEFAYNDVVHNLIPAIVQKEINALQDLNTQKSKKISALKEEVRYLEQVSRDQAKALEGQVNSEKITVLLAGQDEEMKHIKRQKKDIKEENLKMAKEVIALHEANSNLKEQLREVRNQLKGDLALDKLM